MARHVGMNEVARAAKVSQMTVSRVVRGEHTVKPATAERVQRFIKKLGYRPDPALSALAAYRTRGLSRDRGSVLAILETEKSYYNWLVLAGVHEEAARLGYAVETFPLPASVAGQRQLSRQLFHRGFTGLLISPSSEPFRLEGWDWNRFAFVSAGVLRHEAPIHSVAMDYFHGLQTAYAGLRRQGHRRIGLALWDQLEVRTGHIWLGAYLSISRPTLKPLVFRLEEFKNEVMRDWCVAQRPDAVLTTYGNWCEYLDEAGIPIAYLNQLTSCPKSPVIRLEPRQIGIESVQLLHPLLLRREFGLPALPKTVLLRGEWSLPSKSIPEWNFSQRDAYLGTHP